MRNLLELDIYEVMTEMLTVNDIGRPTVQEGLYYLMFIQAISLKLADVDNKADDVSWLDIRDIAIEHGGMPSDYESYDVMLYTRLTYLAATMLAD